MPLGGTPALLRDAGFNAFRWLAFGHETSQAEAPPANLEKAKSVAKGEATTYISPVPSMAPSAWALVVKVPESG